jgi:hypothetical protein
MFTSAKIWLKIEDKIGAITSLECFRCSAVIPNSSALFFKLSFLIALTTIFCLDEQRKCFAKYYEDLIIPNEEQFDNNYLNLCRLRQSLTDDKMDGNNFVPEQFTPNDVVKTIKKLNLKKSADEFGITAEHLKHSSEANCSSFGMLRFS